MGNAHARPSARHLSLLPRMSLLSVALLRHLRGIWDNGDKSIAVEQVPTRVLPLHRVPVMMTKLSENNRPDSLRITHVLAPGEIGGLERVAVGLAASLRSAGHDARLVPIVEEASHTLAHPTGTSGVPVHPIVLPPHSYLRESVRLRRLLQELRPDVIHTHGYHADVVGGLAAWSQGVPVVSTLHGFTGGGRKNRMYEILQRSFTRRFAATIAVSRPMQAALSPLYPPNRLRLIRNAWCNGQPLLSRDAARRKLSLPMSGLVIGWVGRLSREKGPDVLLDSIGRSRRNDYAVSFVGSGRLEAELRGRTSSLDLDDRIRFHGAVPGAGSLLRAFDLFVMSSRTEGTPMVLFEAMAAGVPVVTTDVGGIPDVVSPEEAVLVPSEDAAALATAIDESLDHPDARARAARAEKRLHGECGVDAWVEAHTLLYRSISRPRSKTSF